MRSVWICVLALAWSACAQAVPVSGDVDDTALGLDGADEEKLPDDDSPPLAAKPVVTCFDARQGVSVTVHASKPAEPPKPGDASPLPAPPHGSGDDSCDPDAPQPAEPVPGRPAHPPVLVVVEREHGAVACGCGIGHVERVAGVPANLPDGAPVPGVPPVPPVPARGEARPAAGAESGTQGVGVPGVPGAPVIGTASGGSHTASVPGAPGAPVVTVTISSGAPGEPATIVAPPSCEELTERCYADVGEVELCEQLADCCANTPAPT